MNFPNILTVARIILTFVFVHFIHQPSLKARILAALIFGVASISDLWDGYYARKHNLITNFGKLMDPIADKFLILAAFFVFTQMQLMPIWMFVVISLREVLVTLIRLVVVRGGKVLEAEMAGKLKTTLQIVAISVVLVYLILEQSAYMFYPQVWLNVISILFYAVVTITLVSGIKFFLNFMKPSHV